MQIESLKVFCDLAETESFTKAAQINEVTQSAVSQQISTLEKQFKSLLIERSKKNFRLTPEGQVFYEYSKRILQSLRRPAQPAAGARRDYFGQYPRGDHLQHRAARPAAVSQAVPQGVSDGERPCRVSPRTTRFTQTCWATSWTWAWSPIRSATPNSKSCRSARNLWCSSATRRTPWPSLSPSSSRPWPVTAS